MLLALLSFQGIHVMRYLDDFLLKDSSAMALSYRLSKDNPISSYFWMADQLHNYPPACPSPGAYGVDIRSYRPVQNPPSTGNDCFSEVQLLGSQINHSSLNLLLHECSGPRSDLLPGCSLCSVPFKTFASQHSHDVGQADLFSGVPTNAVQSSAKAPWYCGFPFQPFESIKSFLPSRWKLVVVNTSLMG